MPRSFRISGSLLACVLVGSACSGNQFPTLQITCDPTNQTVGSGNFVTCKVTGTTNGAQFQDQMTPVPTISTDYGSFEKPSTTNPTADDDVREYTSGTVTGHAVTVKLYADPDPGTAHVTASYADAYGNSVEAATTVTFKQGIKTGIVQHLNLSCLTYNMGVLATLSTTVQIPCSANATDSNNQAVVGANIQFISEAGTMRYDSETGGKLFYFPRDPSALHTSPKDVDPQDLPNSAEPSRTSSDGKVHNPRDGLVP